MQLELINTIAALVTVAIVAAAAIAALVQLRHLRAGNQIQALLTVGEKLNSRQYTAALTLANNGLAAALEDPRYRAYEISIWRRLPPPPGIDQHFIDMHHAVVLVGNTFEELGLIVRNRIVDPTMFIDNYCGIALGAWKVLEKFTALGRAAMETNIGWENFEYLAVLSEDWIKKHPTSYPQGVRRMKLHSPWPVPPPDSASQ